MEYRWFEVGSSGLFLETEIMKADDIRRKLSGYYHKESDTILLEVLSGKPRSPEGGSWLEIPVDDLEKITESPDFSPEKTGYAKYLQRWFAEGLITGRERDTGKS
jgi:hypothetical protein